MHTYAWLPCISSGSRVKTKSHGRLIVSESAQMMETTMRYCRGVIIPDSGKVIAAQRSMEIAISVLTDADTDTPCEYETNLQKNSPRIHARNTKKKLIIHVEQKFKLSFISEKYHFLKIKDAF